MTYDLDIQNVELRV